MSSLRATVAQHPIWHLFLMRLRWFLREPGNLFWTFAFPLILTLVLGVAFRNQGPERLAIAVADGPRAQWLTARLGAVEGLTAEALPLAEARERLRTGRVALVVVPGDTFELLVDPSHPESRSARLLTLDTLERLSGRKDVLSVPERTVTAAGARYIDFFLPGIIGLGMMNASLMAVGVVISQIRAGKLLKRMVATPMKPLHFLLSFGLYRCALGSVEILFLLLPGWLLFDVHIFGSAVAFFVLALLGTVAFTGWGLLIASRAQTPQAAAGMVNLFTLPMMALSGVFFSTSRFPGWIQPALKLLPLAALNEGLRAIMINGASLLSVWPQAAIFLLWNAVAFVAALKLFRWS